MCFKLLAVEVLESDISHLRNLKKNTAYILDKNYTIEKNFISYESEDFDLYSKDNDIKINIYAIAGKNGSGKSTVVEIILKIINNLFYAYRLEEDRKKVNFHEVTLVKNLKANLYYKTNEGVFRLNVNSNDDNTWYEVYKYTKDSSSKKYSNPERIQNFSLSSFFYTQVTNYSLYAYNSNIDNEDWVEKVFHKNDGYQTPIVLNPFRKEGNININSENELVYARLLSNILQYNSFGELNLNIGENLKVESLKLSLTTEDYYIDKALKVFNYDLKNKDYSKLILNKAISVFHKNKIYNKIPQKIIDFAMIYIHYKLVSISSKYNEYSDYLKNGKLEYTSLLYKLKKDNSHITFKLRQTLIYLIHYTFEFNTEIEENIFSVKDIANQINSISHNYQFIECLPPPIFKVDILLSSKKSQIKDIKFSSLSSGEKQQIYSISTIYYHLINIDSVVLNKNIPTEKIVYQYVNIIFEEIELYFHPEFQRTFINNFIKGFNEIKFNNIKGINLIFVTHSPFILSDISNNNILTLKIGENGLSEQDSISKSFSANIHDLLKNKFFLDVFIGEFAKNEINELIDFLNKDKHKDSDIEFYEKFICLIDEPILKRKLTEMFLGKFPKKARKQQTLLEAKNKVMKYAKEMGVEIIVK